MNWKSTDTLRMKILRDVFTESPISSHFHFHLPIDRGRIQTIKLIQTLCKFISNVYKWPKTFFLSSCSHLNDPSGTCSLHSPAVWDLVQTSLSCHKCLWVDISSLIQRATRQRKNFLRSQIQKESEQQHVYVFSVQDKGF